MERVSEFFNIKFSEIHVTHYIFFSWVLHHLTEYQKARQKLERYPEDTSKVLYIMTGDETGNNGYDSLTTHALK